MSAVGPRLAATFSSIKTRNYRLYLLGNSFSNIGEWAQRIGQAWLVLELSGSAVLLGVTAALQAAPMVFIGPWGGLIADRVNKRHLILLTQVLSACLAAGLGVLTALGIIEVWMVFCFAFALGGVKAFDHPTKQSFVLELVEPGQLTNAVTLNSVAFNVAKTIGPALGGFLISWVGIASSFFVNAVSYLGMILAVLLMDRAAISYSPRISRGPRQLREGLRYVASTPILAAPMVLMAVTGMLAYEWQVMLPLFARDAFGGDAQMFGTMFSAMGIGSIVGGLGVAGALRPTARSLLGSGTVFSIVFILTGASRNVELAIVALFVLGGANTAFRATGQSILQGNARPEMRGRVTSLLSVAFLGSTLVGGPLIGWLADVIGIKPTMMAIGVCVLAASVQTFVTTRRHPELR
ncbi:MAG: MFS transporter [Roseovarius sp.]|jgi:MFS family permease|nr:MFS transporter [Roseovarius sp.]